MLMRVRLGGCRSGWGCGILLGVVGGRGVSRVLFQEGNSTNLKASKTSPRDPSGKEKRKSFRIKIIKC
jgi:hypothetical protein